MGSMRTKSISIATVSPKYQLAIPRELREAAGIRPGTRFAVILAEGGLRLIRLRPLTELRGVVPADGAVRVRDKSDRL